MGAMSRRSTVVLVALSLLGLSVSCAPRAPAKNAGDDSTEDSDGPGRASRKKPRGKRSREEHRAQFLKVCVKSPDMQAYCDCGWGVMTKMFSDDDMDADDVNEVRLAKLKLAVTKQCADQMPEAMLKDAFVKGCGNGEAALGPYCGCMWSELRKSFSGGELAQPEIVKSSKFTNGVAGSAKTCTPKIPESHVKRQFFDGCAKQPGHEAFCTCAWKDLRAHATVGEIQSSSDTPEMKQAIRAAGEKCRKLLPRGAQ